MLQGEDLSKFVNYNSRFQADFLGSSTLAHLKLGDIIQIHRKGFFVVDQAFHKLLEKPLILISIPDGHDMELTIDHNPLLATIRTDKVAVLRMRAIISQCLQAKQLEDEVAALAKLVKELKTTKASKDAVAKAEAELTQLKSIQALVAEAVWAACKCYAA